jgi:predicted RNA binding protein YcfA (HicA-like mRNA interferase family)
MSHRTKLDKELRQAGYVLVRHSNHLIYRNSQGDTAVVPNHNKINEMIYRKILRQIGRRK